LLDRLGRRIARITIGEEKRIFPVHEELLCTSSLYFRDRLQKNRKLIEGECSICHEDMHTETEEITYCQTCGANFHYNCIKQWEAGNMARDPALVAGVMCPLCRSVWDESKTRTCHCPNLDPEAFGMYNKWLYTKNISIDENENMLNLTYKSLFEAWHFGRLIKDKKFLNAILRVTTELSEETEVYPSAEAIRCLYQWTTANCGLRKLVVDAGAADVEAESFVEGWDLIPDLHKKDLVMALLRLRDGEVQPSLMERLHTILEAEGDGF
jgi:hypothetical protein